MLLAEGQDSAVQIAEFGGKLVFACLRVLPHPPLKRLTELLIFAFEQYLYIGGSLLVFGLCAKPFDTWAETAFKVVFETRSGQFAVNLDLAGAKLEGTVYQIQRIPGHRRGQERAVVAGAVTGQLTRNNDFWEGFVRKF